MLKAFMPCLQGVSTCGGVLVSLLCHLTTSLTRFWFQLLRKNVSSSACGELHVHLLFLCVCFNFVFCNFFWGIASKIVSSPNYVPRVNCSDHADTQGILLRSFRISGYFFSKKKRRIEIRFASFVRHEFMLSEYKAIPRTVKVKRKGPTGWKSWKVIAKEGWMGFWFLLFPHRLPQGIKPQSESNEVFSGKPAVLIFLALLTANWQAPRFSCIWKAEVV